MGATGWTWDYVRQTMTFSRYKELQQGWRRNPPVHFLLAALVSYKPPPEVFSQPQPETRKPQQEQSLADLIRDFTAAGGVVNGSYHG